MTRILFLLAILFLSLEWYGISYGDDMQGPEPLAQKYQEIRKDLENSPFTVPFHLESSVTKNASLVDIYGTIKHPFGIVENELQSPANWCDIVMPHINVRACTSEKAGDTWLLAIYTVDRFDESIDEAYKMKFEYHAVMQQPGYFKVLLYAPEGSFGTKEHRFMLEAIALDEGMTFIHFRYGFNYGFLGYLGMKSYFSIFERGKIGFSAIATDKDGNATYVSGLRGAIERSIVLYYLAIPSYIDTLDILAEQRFEKRIIKWYDLTTQYKRGLSEMEKEEYLTYKRQDRENQLKLQGAIGK